MDAELVGEVFGGTQAPAMDRGVTDRYGLAATVWRLRSGSPAAGAVTVLCTENRASQPGIHG